METESEERKAYLRRHRERDGARWASPTVDQTQARLEHNASYRHTHLQQLATNRQRTAAIIFHIFGASVSEPPLVDSTDALSRYI